MGLRVEERVMGLEEMGVLEGGVELGGRRRTPLLRGQELGFRRG